MMIETATTNTVKERRGQPVRLGIIGCGYVTAMSHLPASKMVQDIRVTGLVDLNLDLCRQLGETYEIGCCSTDYRDLFDQVDAAIIAVPHHFHFPIAMEFIQRGKHVLVEKPMAVSVPECQELIQAADAHHVKLAVGLMRRYYDSSRAVQRIINTGFLGKIRAFHAQETVLFDNFKASQFTVQPPFGGVLLDTGPHTLDLLQWWFGNFVEVKYWDDARGGVETNCRIEVEAPQGVTGLVELSRTRRLPNKIQLEFEYGEVEFLTNQPDHIQIHSELFSSPIEFAKVTDSENPHDLTPYFAIQLENFSRAILNDEPLLVSGEEGMRSIKVIDYCKNNRQTMDVKSWETLNQNIIRRIKA
jgi:predicted dehydrogenase